MPCATKGAAKRREERLGMRSAVALKRRASLDTMPIDDSVCRVQSEAFRAFFQDLKVEQPRSAAPEAADHGC